MTDENPKNDGSDDDAFKVEIPDDLLDEAVSAVERRVGDKKADPELESTIPEEPIAEGEESTDGMGIEESVEIPMGDPGAEASSEVAADLEAMSVDDLMAGGYLPDKVVTELNESRQKTREAKAQAEQSRERTNALMAEADSFRKRVTREKNEALKFANEPLLKEILPVLDNLERALAHAEQTDAAATGIRQGVEITVRQFHNILAKLGVTKVASERGVPFDPRMHEAVQHMETSDVPPGSVAMALQSGWILHDRLLRPAMVAVAKAIEGSVVADPTEEMGLADSPTAPEADGIASTNDEILSRIRRAGEAVRAARQEKREERDEARRERGEPTSEDRLFRMRDAAARAREARDAERQEEKLGKIRAAGAAKRGDGPEASEPAGIWVAPPAKPVPPAPPSPPIAFRLIPADPAAAKIVPPVIPPPVRVEVPDDEPPVAVWSPAGAPAAAAAPAEAPASAPARAETWVAPPAKPEPPAPPSPPIAFRLIPADPAAAKIAPPVIPPPVRVEVPEDEPPAPVWAPAGAPAEAPKAAAPRPAAAPAAPAAPGAATPSFEDDDLSDWESSVDAIRTDTESGRRRG